MSEATSPEPTPPQSPPPRNNWGWMGYFVFIIVASVGVAGFMIWFNLSVQLTPEQLEEAHKRWKEQKIRNYNMLYTKRLNDDKKTDKFEVEVRGGEVKKVHLNGKPLQTESKEDDPLAYHSMDRLFRDIERFMDIDQKPGAPKVYVTAIFDEKTGAIRRYIRRVMGSNQRIEMNVTLEEVEK
jgi:hypothetical protein